jgi:hypothetical protein
MPRLRFACMIAALLLSPTLTLADGAGPAVSVPNAKISGEGGQYDGDQTVLGRGSFALPLGRPLGLQFDGALGRVDHDTLGGGGLHLFTRDPSSYLLGLYGSYHTWNSIDIGRAAAEVQLYVDRFTFEGLAGYESVDLPSTVGGLRVINPDENNFFTYADLVYYLTDDLRIYGGYRYVAQASLGAAGFEYLLRDYGSPISIFASSDFGTNDFNFTRITGGLRFYFGCDPNESLITRQRTEHTRDYTPMFPGYRLEPPAQVIVVPPDVGGEFPG